MAKKKTIKDEVEQPDPVAEVVEEKAEEVKFVKTDTPEIPFEAVPVRRKRRFLMCD